VSIELWNRMPPPNSVGTTQLQDNAVTTVKIADGAVTATKAAASLANKFILGDDTTVTSTLTTYEEKKKFNFYKNTTIDQMNWQTMEVVAELSSSAPTVTASLGVFVDTEATPRLELTTTSTTLTVLTGNFSIADLSTGLHTISIRLKVSAAGTATNRHLEIQAKPT
jgi:hypothetical protein